MQKVPFFSVIIPAYNVAEDLGRCLESVISQDFADWEAVIVDDCSSDATLSVAGRYAEADARIKVFKSENNSGGAYVPRVRAASLAAGKFLVIIDADDYVTPDLLSLHYDKISKEGADLAVPEMWRVEGARIFKFLPIAEFDDSAVWEGRELVERTLRYWQFPMAGFAVRREVYLAADASLSPEDKKSVFADELLSRWVLFLSGKVAFTAARYYYRLNPASVTRTDSVRFVRDKMMTCNSLISMTEKTFGCLSAVNLIAFDNKFLSAVDSLRLANEHALKRHEIKKIEETVASEMNGFPYSLLRRRMSPRYLALMRLPVPLARRLLKLLDHLLNKKK